MIKLKLDPWCTHCMIFEPYADRPEKYWDNDGNEKYTRETIWVRCKYAAACEEIIRRQIHGEI